MQRFLGLMMFICLLFSGNCFAMQFSQPIEIGEAGIMQAGGGGVYIDGADYNSGKFYTKYRKDNTRGYEKGIARFGNEQDALYIHYSYGKYLKFGGQDINNTIEDNFPSHDIYKINTNENIVIYPLVKIYGPEFDYLIIGRRADGRFIKYIDTREITKRYFGWNKYGASPATYMDLTVQGDTLIMKYHYRNRANRTITEGRFIFKWDDNAQWFGIDKTVDNVRSGY